MLKMTEGTNNTYCSGIANSFFTKYTVYVDNKNVRVITDDITQGKLLTQVIKIYTR